MALFEIEQCTKCGANCWRLTHLDKPVKRASLVCEFCGRELRIDGDRREQGGRQA